MSVTIENDAAGKWEVGDGQRSGARVRVLVEPTPEFLDANKAPVPSVYEQRRAEYPTTDDLVIALWEQVVEGRPEAATALQEVRDAIKAKYPTTTKEPPTRWERVKKFFGVA